MQTHNLCAKKIAFIGASYLFVYRVIKDLANCGVFRGSRIAIYDIDPEPAAVIAEMGRRISTGLSADFDVTAVKNRAEALDGADFVFLCISVGGREAGKTDIEICRRYGCDHVIGDTAGPAALSRCLRAVPVVREIAQAIDAACPNATVINFTNPMTVITATLARNTRARVIGLCHGAVGSAPEIARAYGVPVSDVEFDLAGVNHFAFLTEVRIGGKVVDMQDMFTRLAGGDPKDQSRDLATGAVLDIHYTLKVARRLGYMTNNHDRHTVEFYPWFLHPWKKLYTRELADYDGRIRDIQNIAAWSKRVAAGQEEIPDLKAPSGEDAEGIMFALMGDKQQRFAINVPNNGAIAGLADNALVEVFKLVSSKGIHNEKTIVMPPHIHSIIQRLVVIQEYTMEAARTGRRDLAMQALMLEANNPDFEGMDEMLDELLANNAKVLASLK